jgi:hypothetical protein
MQLAPPLRQQHTANGQHAMHATGGPHSGSLSAGADGVRAEQLVSNVGDAGHSASTTRGWGNMELVGPGFSVPCEERPTAVTPMKPEKWRAR